MFTVQTKKQKKKTVDKRLKRGKIVFNICGKTDA